MVGTNSGISGDIDRTVGATTASTQYNTLADLASGPSANPRMVLAPPSLHSAPGPFSGQRRYRLRSGACCQVPGLGVSPGLGMGSSLGLIRVCFSARRAMEVWTVMAR
jgi:hypothetical protein